jgi:hypothetical protein
MDSLAWQATHEWNCAKNQYKTIEQMQQVWQDLTKSANYQCLAEKRKSTIFFLWHHIRNTTLSQNQIHGRCLNGKFYSSWRDLPEEYKASDALLKTLPSGHFWGDGNGQATTIRYFIASDSAGEDKSHFLAPQDANLTLT